jgi:hypothetical protein
MKTLILMLILLCTSCATPPVKSVLIDDSLISTETATAIFFTSNSDTYEIFIDGISYGVLTRHAPMRLEVDAGAHKVWGKNSVTLDRRTDVQLLAGKTYIFSVYWHQTGLPGMVASRVTLVPDTESYQAYECLESEAGSKSCPGGVE